MNRATSSELEFAQKPVNFIKLKHHRAKAKLGYTSSTYRKDFKSRSTPKPKKNKLDDNLTITHLKSKVITETQKSYVPKKKQKEVNQA